MAFNSPDLETFKTDLDNNIRIAQNMKKDSHASIKIQSLLNITIYTLATRFLEGSIKLIIYNCAIMRGDDPSKLEVLETALKTINNPNYGNIKKEFSNHLSFDITQGISVGGYTDSDIKQLNEIVNNRHKNVHANHDPSQWYNSNLKDIIGDFPNEYPGLINIVTYLDRIKYDSTSGTFIH